jgi:hypothetical protein
LSKVKRAPSRLEKDDPGSELLNTASTDEEYRSTALKEICDVASGSNIVHRRFFAARDRFFFVFLSRHTGDASPK